MIIRVKRYTREEIRKNTTSLYVFGDNLVRKGMGGQAGEARYEPNAIGIATKVNPGRFFDDEMLPYVLFNEFLPKFQTLHAYHQMGGTVVYPEDGIGTGLSELPERAPAIWKALQEMEAWLFTDASKM